MSRSQWFVSSDDSKSVIRPEHQENSKYRCRENLVVVFATSMLSGFGPDLGLSKTEHKLRFFGGESDIYESDLFPNTTFIDGAISAPIGVSAVETAVTNGVERVFALGLIGAVAESLQLGSVVIPQQCEREEGTSYHYAGRDLPATPDPLLFAELCQFLSSADVRYQVGSTVSTDAPYRQTITTELEWRERGLLGVDMEMSAIFTLGRYLAVPTVGLFVVSDAHDLTGKREWKWDRSIFRDTVKQMTIHLGTFASGHISSSST